MLEIRTSILQTKLLCAKARKKRKRACEELTEPVILRAFIHSVVILRAVSVRFYRTGEEIAFERHCSRVLTDKEQKQALLN